MSYLRDVVTGPSAAATPTDRSASMAYRLLWLAVFVETAWGSKGPRTPS